jgi:hypothetical protein
VIFGEIRFDMSREGLTELSTILEGVCLTVCGEEVLNFANEIRAMSQKEQYEPEESWLDG